MKLSTVMETMTLRQMAVADDLWRAEVGPQGQRLQAALADENYRAIAAMVAAKLRIDGDPDATIETALDLELDTDQDTDQGEVTRGNGGEQPRLSRVTGS